MRGLADIADLADACGVEGGGAEMPRDMEGEERGFAAAFQLLLRRAAQETLTLLPLPGRTIVYSRPHDLAAHSATPPWHPMPPLTAPHPHQVALSTWLVTARTRSRVVW